MLAFRVLLVLALTLTACTKKKPVSQKPGESADVFSTRPISDVPDLYLITLRSPPLLKVATKTGGSWQIPSEAKEAILNEQAQFELKLKSLIPGAQILYRYRLTVNGLAVYAKGAEIPLIETIPGLSSVTPVRRIARPDDLEDAVAPPALGRVNSVNFMGVEAAYRRGITGLGQRIGVIDSGIDYTHAMMGGSGSADAYKAINPNLPSTLFPNAKVTGGIDLVGSEFDASSEFYPKRFPLSDPNPLDESGHGTHVAGSIAGIGDGVNGYNGVAKDAELVAIKVFGKDGATMDAVVIAGFEYAADPNGDLSPDDQLDVVNLSLGGGYGQPQLLYTEAIGNLVNAGTVVVASAGNSGPTDYIVGSPGTSEAAISVAASVDGSDHNWKFATVKFSSTSDPERYSRFVEGAVTKPLEQFPTLSGELVDIGLADAELSDELKAKLNGKVALISRGGVPFLEKLGRAQAAGAIAAVVYNNQPGDAFIMGGEGTVDIPGVMVTQEMGMWLVAELALGPVTVDFKTPHLAEQPEIIDTITNFSSKGPRSDDNLIKPEISAPGGSIISAEMGGGTTTVMMSGTSMAAPHMAGAAALFRQAFPGLSASDIKALTMNSSKILTTAAGPIPISLQGAGRVQVDRAVEAKILVTPGGLSLGRISLENQATQTRALKIRNLTSSDLSLTIKTESAPGLVLRAPATVSVPASGETEISVEAAFAITQDAVTAAELNGRVFFHEGQTLLAQVPALAIRMLAANISTAQTSASQAIQFSNFSPHEGLVLAFNLLGEDDRKPTIGLNGETWLSSGCDVQSVGYRILTREVDGQPKEILQFGFKVFTPVTTWHYCEPIALIDSNEDGVADQELAGVSENGVEGLEGFQFASVLLDAAMARGLRFNFEEAITKGKEGTLNYTKALVSLSPMAPFNHSTIAIIEAPLELVEKTATGAINVKAAAVFQGGSVIEGDDYLGTGEGTWTLISPDKTQHPFFNIPDSLAVPKGSNAVLGLSRSATPGKLILYYPLNTWKPEQPDGQYQILE